MTGDKPFVAVMWLCMMAIVAGYGLGYPTLAAVAAPVAIGTFIAWAWWTIRRKRQTQSGESRE